MSIQKHKKNEIVKFDREAFAARFSPKNIRKEFRHVNSLKKAVEADTNSIAVYRKQSSPEFVEVVVVSYLLDLNNSTNTHHELNEEQIEELAQDITTLYFQMSLVEIHYVIKQGKRGKFGKVGTFAINEETVLGWFEKYAEERCQYFMQRKTSEGIEHKQNSESQIFPKEIIPTIVDAVKGMGEKMDEAENFKDAEFEIYKDKYNQRKRKN